MNRKKWTPKTEVTQDILKAREKKKWQLALRRYIIEKKPSYDYAPYFGIDIEGFREWIAVQFDMSLNWGNFGISWQLDHVIPMSYFDFSKKDDLLLCWNFLNIRVEKITESLVSDPKQNILSAKNYFFLLYDKTQLDFLLDLVAKIESIEKTPINISPAIFDFITTNNDRILKLKSLQPEDLLRVNQGVALNNVLIERDIVNKFGNQ